MLTISDLTVKYGARTVINNLSTQFEKGGFCCVTGPNGCGKTTLLKAIEGLIKCEGRVEYDGVELLSLTVKERAKVITYLPQNRPVPNIEGSLMIEHGRFPHLGFTKTLCENDIAAIDRAVELTDTSHLLQKRLTEMSGGEQQRVYIASAVAQETDVLLLDEPTTHLDLKNQLETLQLMLRLKEAGKTVIAVLHDLAQAFSFGDTVYVMNGGDIVLSGKPDEIYQNEIISAAFGYGIAPDTDENALYKYKLLK